MPPKTLTLQAQTIIKEVDHLSGNQLRAKGNKIRINKTLPNFSETKQHKYFLQRDDQTQQSPRENKQTPTLFR